MRDRTQSPLKSVNLKAGDGSCKPNDANGVLVLVLVGSPTAVRIEKKKKDGCASSNKDRYLGPFLLRCCCVFKQTLLPMTRGHELRVP